MPRNVHARAALELAVRPPTWVLPLSVPAHPIVMALAEPPIHQAARHRVLTVPSVRRAVQVQLLELNSSRSVFPLPFS